MRSLLSFVTTIERIYIETRTADICGQRRPRRELSRAMFKTQVEGRRECARIVRWARLEDYIAGRYRPRSRVTDGPRPPAGSRQPRFKILDDRRTELAVLTRPEAQAPEIKRACRVSGRAFARFARLLERSPGRHSHPRSERRHRGRSLPDCSRLDPDELKYATKVGLRGSPPRLRGWTGLLSAAISLS